MPDLPITFRVRCSGATHTITLTKRGNLMLLDHPELLGDEVMAALSGNKCRCLALRDTWYEFQRGRPKDSVLIPPVPKTLPAALARYSALITNKLRDRSIDRKADHDFKRLYGTSLQLNEASPKSAFRKDARQRIKRVLQERWKLRCEEIMREVDPRLTYDVPVTHSWTTPFLHVPYRWLEQEGNYRPTFSSFDEALQHPDKSNVLIGIARSLRWHVHPILMFRAYIKAHCMLLDKKGRVIATSAVGARLPNQQPGRELFFAARQDDTDLTIGGCWCYAEKGTSGLWEVRKWLPQPPRNIVLRSLEAHV
jgi:hypothetical protein